MYPILLKVIIQGLSPYLSKNSITENNILGLTTILDNAWNLMRLNTIEYSPDNIIRLTINKNISIIGNKRINEINFIKYPDRKYVTKYGRCNLIGESIFYGTTNFMTAVKEMKPQIGDLLTISKWKLKEENSLKLFPIFFPSDGNKDDLNGLSIDLRFAYDQAISLLSKNDQDCNKLLLEFLANCFAKETDSDNHLDYYLSAYLSSKIFNSQEKIDGIIYPSVPEKHSLSNFALQPQCINNKFELIEVKEKIIYDYINQGAWLNTLGISESLDIEKGTINWRSSE